MRERLARVIWTNTITVPLMAVSQRCTVRR
jgi:hypothetical protein